VTAAQHVLLVDGLAETEEVLRAVLEPRGLKVDRIRSPRSRDFSETRRPSVVVLHVEDEPSPVSRTSGWQDVPRILIGATKSADRSFDGADAHYLEKPFQYAELIRTIEQLLAASDS
jgi:DNA-binding response OmpR family regulator